jgi:hypothetical protein
MGTLGRVPKPVDLDGNPQRCFPNPSILMGTLRGVPKPSGCSLFECSTVLEITKKE